MEGCQELQLQGNHHPRGGGRRGCASLSLELPCLGQHPLPAPDQTLGPSNISPAPSVRSGLSHTTSSVLLLGGLFPSGPTSERQGGWACLTANPCVPPPQAGVQPKTSNWRYLARETSSGSHGTNPELSGLSTSRMGLLGCKQR